MNQFKCYGILWNGNYSFADDFLKDVNNAFKIESLYYLDINDLTYEFVKKIYPKLLPDEYAHYKADMLKNHECVKVIAFRFNIPFPVFKYNPEEYQNYCVQVKELKTNLRKKYIPKIQGYEHDILSHFADNEDESALIRKALVTNKSRVIKIVKFTDKDNNIER